MFNPLKWFFGKKTPPVAASDSVTSVPEEKPVSNSESPAEPLAGEDLEKALADLRSAISDDVKAGFESEEDICQRAVDFLCEEYEPEVLFPHAERLTREALEAHAREQESWPKRTDCDGLNAAFEELEKAGIVARQNFACCGNCATSEIGGEMEAAREQGLEVRGYAYYHMQDTEGAARGRGLYIGYGAVKQGEAAALEIAREIVAALQRQGLLVEWNESSKTRILARVEWKRRRSLVIAKP